MRTPVTIQLAGASYAVRPLTCRQIQDVELVLAQKAGGATQSIGIIKAGLARDHAAVDVDQLEISVDEMQPAMQAILAQAGFKTTAGETTAAAGTAK